MHAIPVFVALAVFSAGFGYGQRFYTTEDGKMWGGALIGAAATTVVIIAWVAIVLAGLGGF